MNAIWRAGHLPGVDERDVEWHTLAFASRGGDLRVEVPRLTPLQMAAVAGRVRDAAATLRRMRVSEIIAVIDAVVARLLDADEPVRRQMDAMLSVVTGDDPELVRLGLTAYLKTFRAPQLHRFVAQDFANPKVLDEFQPAVKGGAVRACGPRVLAHVWAGNVPGLPLWSLVCGLLVKAGNVGKLPSAEPVFATLFARMLAEVHPALSDCVAVVWWKGGEADAASALFAQSEVVLAYGGNAALAEVRAQVPVTARFLGYGHKVGLALVARAALDMQRGPELARLLARDLVRHEQQGCYSPHVAYVERGGAVEPRLFAQYVAAELANLERRHPRRALSLPEATDVAGWRQGAESRAMTGASELLCDDAAGWAVEFAHAPEPLAPTGGYRCVRIVGVDTLDAVAPVLAPHAAFLQTAGVAAEPSRLHALAVLLGDAGITRIASIGGMTRPEAGWHHDGRFNLLDLVRMVEIEQAAEQAAERYAPYAQEDGA